MLLRFLKYAFRWQLSTPILAVCVAVLPGSTLWRTVIANAVGAALFYHVDKLIFKHTTHPANRKK